MSLEGHPIVSIAFESKEEATLAGLFQTEKYWYEWCRGGEDAREPVTRTQVRALITEPNQGSQIERGDIAIRGVAWSGESARAAPGIRPA